MKREMEPGVPLTTAVQNIKSRHLHDIGVTVPDERHFLKSWRRSLQELITQQNSSLLSFLVASGGSGSDKEPDLTRRCNDVLAKYSKPAWSFTASTKDLVLPVSPLNESAASWAQEEIGLDPLVLREHLRKTIQLYIQTASKLSAVEGRLNEKLQRLEVVVSRINELMFLEPSCELEGLTAPTREYLESVYSKLSIEEDYKELTEQYARFSLLKELVSLAGFQRTGTSPTCTICMTKEVTHAVIPCGHTFCDECCNKQMTGCFICRVQIRDRLRLYYS
jgi:hypothetical protein